MKKDMSRSTLGLLCQLLEKKTVEEVEPGCRLFRQSLFQTPACPICCDHLEGSLISELCLLMHISPYGSMSKCFLGRFFQCVKGPLTTPVGLL